MTSAKPIIAMINGQLTIAMAIWPMTGSHYGTPSGYYMIIFMEWICYHVSKYVDI